MNKTKYEANSTDLDDQYYYYFCSRDNILRGFLKAKKGVNWKHSVQYFGINLGYNIEEISDILLNKKYKPLKYKEFVKTERGKTRYIKAVQVRDRVIQNMLCELILIPELSKYLIYDNGASLKDKGLDFSRRRFEHHLHNFWINHRRNGYILLIDYSKFFDSIVHNILFDMVEEKISNQDKILNIFKIICNTFEINGDYRKSLGIGSYISQISGLFYVKDIDNYMKIVRSFKYYGRYMDDSYVIAESKEELYNLLDDLTDLCNKYGIMMNMKKTRILKLDEDIIWLKIRYKLEENGRIINIVNKDVIKRERTKLKKQYKKLLDGNISIEKIYNNYQSFKNTYKRYDSKNLLYELDKDFNALFGEDVKLYLYDKETKKNHKLNFSEIMSMKYH